MYTLIIRQGNMREVKLFENVETHVQYRSDENGVSDTPMNALALTINETTVLYTMPTGSWIDIQPQRPSMGDYAFNLILEEMIMKFDDYIQEASRLTFEAYDDYTLEEMANRLSFKIFECRSVFRTLPKNTRMLYIIAYNETIHEIRRRNEK